MKKTIIPEHTTSSDTQPGVAKAPQEDMPTSESASLMAMKTVVDPSAKKQPTLVAYAGDMLDTETHKNKPEDMTFGASLGDTTTPPPALMMTEPAADSMDTTATTSATISGSANNESVSLSGSPVTRIKTETGVSFSEIIERAQKEANSLIVENERSLYVLKTPIVSYVSRESKTQKNTVELVAVYTFPLEKTDGKVSKVKEISIEIE